VQKGADLRGGKGRKRGPGVLISAWAEMSSLVKTEYKKIDRGDMRKTKLFSIFQGGRKAIEAGLLCEGIERTCQGCGGGGYVSVP